MIDPGTKIPRAPLRALVVEPDAGVRLKVTGMLQEYGCEVDACAGFAGGDAYYDRQDIIVAPVDGDDTELIPFLERVRALSRDEPPYILGLSAERALEAGNVDRHPGLNDIVPWTGDSGSLASRLGSIIQLRAGQPRPPETATAPHDGWSSPASQVLLEQLPAAVAVLDQDMTYVAANGRWLREFQITGLHLVGESHYDVFPDLHPAWRDLYARCLAGHRERSDDDLLVRPDGSQDWVRWDIQPWRNAQGVTGGLILACTVVKAGGLDPVRSAFDRDLVHSLLNSPAAPAVIVDTQGRISRLNGAAREIRGELSVIEGQTFFWNALIPPAGREAARERVRELIALAGPGHQESWPVAGGNAVASPAAAGGERITGWSVFPHRRADGTLEGLIFLGLPPAIIHSEPAMTHGASASFHVPPPEKSGDQHLDEFRQIAEAAPFGMVVLSEEAELIYANPQHRVVLGFSVEECGGMPRWLERACAADEDFKRRALEEWWERVWRRRAAWTCPMRTAAGMLKEVEFRPSQLPGHKLLLTIFDVTDARMEEQAIRASEARYRGLFQHCPDGVIVLNSSGNITEANPSFEQLTGCSRMEIRRSGPAAFLPEKDVALVRQAALSGNVPGREIATRVTAKDGTSRPAGLSISVLKNDEGLVVYTACYLHPLHGSGTERIEAPAAWEGSDWSRVVPDCVLMLDGRGRILEHSDARDFAGVLPPAAKGLTGRSLEEALPGIAELLPLDVMMERLRENPGAETRCEFSAILTQGGRTRFIEARLVSLALPEREETGDRYGLVLRDLTTVAGRHQATSGAGSGVMPWLRNLDTPVILSNERGRVTGLNPAAEALLGWTSAELEGNGLFRIFRPGDPKSFSEEISREVSGRRRWKTRAPFFRRDGTSGEALVELVSAHEENGGSRGFLVLFHSVESLAGPAPSRPSVTLHRARNDLQILSSLLVLETERATVEGTRQALHAMRDRLGAVALIYRLISGEGETVDFQRYVKDLGRQLLEGRGVAGRIKIEPPLEATRLPQKTAITLGLILGELLSAILADSFAGETGGLIRVSLTTGGGEALLLVRDSGAVLSAAALEARLEGLPWQVIKLLAAQTGGTPTLTNDLENQASLRFRLVSP